MFSSDHIIQHDDIISTQLILPCSSRQTQQGDWVLSGEVWADSYSYSLFTKGLNGWKILRNYHIVLNFRGPLIS